MTRRRLMIALIFVATLVANCVTPLGRFAHAEDLDISTEWSWSKAEPTIYESTPVDNLGGAHCLGSYETVKVVDLGPGWVCSDSNDARQLRIASFDTWGIETFRFDTYSDVYAIYGTTCENSGKGCYYIPKTDTLIMEPHLINNIVYALTIYKNFSDRLSEKHDRYGRMIGYDFHRENPDYTYQSADGYPWPVEAVAPSNNGKWLAIELRSKGFAVMNLATYEVKRFTTFSMGYGGGADPGTELAITDDGNHIALMGFRAGGVMIYDRTPTCGDDATDAALQYEYPIANPCPKYVAYTEGFIPRFSFATSPKFRFGGAELHFYVTSVDEKWLSITLDAANFHPPRLDYLALGDSFTSGEGETSDEYYLDGTNDPLEKCHLSTRSYPYLVAEYMGINPTKARSVACSGAKTSDVVGSDVSYWGQADRLKQDGLGLNKNTKTTYQQSALDTFSPGRTHQLEFVKRYQPRVITIGIGGNDVGFMEKLKTCVGPGTCEWASSPKMLEQTAVEIRNGFDTLVSTYKQIHDASPTSKIYVIGYPQVIDPSGDCSLINGLLLDPTERQFMSQAIVYMNQVIAAAAKAAGVGYISTEASFGDQVLCGSNTPSLMNAIRLGDDDSPSESVKWLKIIGKESFHPRPDGHIAIANAIEQAVPNLTTFNYCKDVYSYIYSYGVYCPNPYIGAPWMPDYWLDGGVTHDYEILQVGEFVEQPPSATSTPTDQHITFAADTFTPGSTISAEIHSDPTVLGTFTADANGGADFVVTLPSDLSAGFHTIHIYSTLANGKSADIYQVIQYVPVPTVPSPPPSIPSTEPIVASSTQTGTPTVTPTPTATPADSSTPREVDTPSEQRSPFSVIDTQMLVGEPSILGQSSDHKDQVANERSASAMKMPSRISAGIILIIALIVVLIIYIVRRRK